MAGHDSVSLLQHLVLANGRAGVLGLFVSSSPYTEPAVKESENALSQRVIVLAEVNEILMLLEDPDATLATGPERRSWQRAWTGSHSSTPLCERARRDYLAPTRIGD